MYFTYLAQSISNPEKYYKGHTDDLKKRLMQHNQGMTKSIKHLIPLRIIYYESFETREIAIKSEKYWKTAAGRRYLQSQLKNGPVVQWIE